MTVAPYRCRTCGFELWVPVADLSVSSAGLYDDARFPGRLLVALHEHHEDFIDLPDVLAQALVRDVRTAARAARKVLGADRVNIAVLGNAHSHVHFHLVPRVRDGDPAPDRAPWESPLPKDPLDRTERDRLARTLGDAVRAVLRNDEHRDEEKE